MKRFTRCVHVFAVAAALLFQSPEAKAQEVLAAFDFEDGRTPGPDGIAFQTHIPAEVLTESNGNHFLRLYASPEDSGVDDGPPFFTTYPTVRSELLIGTIDWWNYNPVTVSFSMRIHSENTPLANMLAQFYQYGPNSGWVTALSADTGQIAVTSKDGDEFELRNNLFMGSILHDQWVTMAITVLFSPDTEGGRMGVTMNGQDMGTVSGRTLKNMTDPMSFYLNLYGDPILPYGIIDYDNLLIQTGTVAVPVINEDVDENGTEDVAPSDPADVAPPPFDLTESEPTTTIIESHSIASETGYTSITGTLTAAGQVFTPSVSSYIRSAQFTLSSENNPEGMIFASLYAVTGTPGSTAMPTGAALAVSGMDVSALPSWPDVRVVTFDFIPYEMLMSAGVPHAIVVEYTGGSSTNTVPTAKDRQGRHPGNLTKMNSGVWSADSAQDMIFSVSGDVVSSFEPVTLAD